jgi:hypothetical protein
MVFFSFELYSQKDIENKCQNNVCFFGEFHEQYGNLELLDFFSRTISEKEFVNIVIEESVDFAFITNYCIKNNNN